MGYGLKYTFCEDMNLQGFSDLDCARCVPDSKSTSDCYFILGFAMISWCSGKQSYLAQSTLKAEYVTAFMATGEAM